MRLSPRIKTRLDARLQTRLSSAIQAMSRYFRRNEGTTDYIAIPPVVLSGDFKIKWKSSGHPAGSNQVVFKGEQNSDSFIYYASGSGRLFVKIAKNDGSNAFIGLSATSPNLSQYVLSRTNDLFTLSNEVEEVQLNVPSAKPFVVAKISSGLSGIVADADLTDDGSLIRSYALDDNSDVVVDTVSSQNGTVIDGNSEDWKLFDRDNNDWVRDAVLYEYNTNYMPNPNNPENWTGAFNSVKGLITNVISQNPAGQEYIGRVEYLSEYLELNSSTGNRIPSFANGFVYCGIVVRVLPEDENVKLFYRIDAANVQLKQAEVFTKTVQSSAEINVTELKGGYRLIMSRLWIGVEKQEIRGRFFISPSSTAGTVCHAQNTFFGLSDSGWPSSTEERLESL